MDWNEISNNWREVLSAVSDGGGEASELTIEQPCTPKEVAEIEASLGSEIPISFKETLIQFSRRVEFRWSLSTDFGLSSAVDEATSGELCWSCDEIVSINKSREEWAKMIAPNPIGSYDLIWHNKFAFQSIGNGDFLAIDTSSTSSQPVVYLSHDDGHGHGFLLGSDFQDFLRRWSYIGCSGGEYWKWLPFVHDPDSFVDPKCENARIWREALGLKA